MDKTAPFKFDKIGYWSELKLEIVQKYGSAYTSAFKKSPTLKKYYIDAFSGAGMHISKKSGKQVEGSPARALKITPPFDGYYFIDLDQQKTKYLQSLCGKRADVHIHNGDCNTYLTTTLLPTIQYAKFNRALCLLDPYGLHLSWEVIKASGASGAIDMFLNFPVMDMNRNAIWKNPKKVPREGVERMNTFWGDPSWKDAAYSDEPDLFGPRTVKQGNEDVVEAFRGRLKTTAGFKFVPEPLPMKNKANATIYYLFFASQNSIGDKIISDIFKKYR